MFSDRDSIQRVVDSLERRYVSLWHACQLRDLDAYLAAGGIPSRQLLERRGLSFTPFVTDATDRRNGVWSKVFFNLADFGASFARGWRAVPNPYGPIALQVRPAALLDADDVAVCLRSAGASDFDRHGESLTVPADLDRLFAYPPTAGVFQGMEPLFGDWLREAFAPRFPFATAPEASLSLKSGHVGLEHLVAVWVDPVRDADASLIDMVLERVGGAVPVQPRWMTDDRRIVFADILRFLSDDTPPRLRLLRGRGDASVATREWAGTVEEAGLDWQFERFARYLREGTLEVLRQARRPGHAAGERSTARSGETAAGRPAIRRLALR